MSETVNEHDARVCEWCAKSIPQQAIKCPHCRGWRKDIYKDRIKCYFWSAIGGISMGLFIAGYRLGWWHELKTSPGQLGSLFPSYEFSFEAFLTSYSGIIIFIGIILGVLLSLVYGVKVSRKIGSWWWY